MIKLKIIFIFLFLCFCKCSLFAQLNIIKSLPQYDSCVKANPKNKLIDVKKLMPSLILDLKYATKNNFTKKKLYKKAFKTYLRYDAAMALLAIQNKLKEQGYGLKIFDAYRPYEATKLMWELIKDERYVANPAYGSGHNKGISVDLTIVELSTNKELNMGTGFDNFTELAHHSYTDKLDTVVRENRILLKTIMEKYGFKI